MIVALPTKNGSVVIEDQRESADCISCSASGGGMATVTLHAVDHDDVSFHMCGTCLTTGLRDVIAESIKA